MQEQDFRSIKDDARNELRDRAIRLIKNGEKKQEVAKIIGCNPNTISVWWKNYIEKGKTGLKSKQRGRKDGEFRLLKPEQEAFIKMSIIDKMPDQIKLPYALWSRKAIRDLIKREYGITLAQNTVGGYLKKWGFTPQKPKKQAYERSNVAVKKWLDEQFPTVSIRAKEENAEIHWGDETGIRNDNSHGRSYALAGKTPVRRHLAKRLSFNMISTVTNQGKVRFMTYSENLSSKVLIEFLKRLIRDSDKKVFLILDNLRVHHSKKVKEWIAENKNEIEIFYLPSYSPDLNPDEYLNCDLKCGLSNKTAPKTKNELKKNVNAHMRLIQRNPARVISYFKHKSIKYAA
jgi:transposase